MKPGDVVWDIGANIGYYTLELAKQVGANGWVVAIEPSPSSATKISEALQAQQVINASLINVALGSRNGIAQFEVGDDPTSVTNHVVLDTATSKGQIIEVPIHTGDSLINRFELRRPNIIKLDVEGHELECLRGLEEILKSQELRAIFVEVHFAALEAMGDRLAPIKIENLLVNAGFRSVIWIDSSHIGAFNKTIN